MTRKIYTRAFKKSLSSGSGLSFNERKYVQKAFGGALADGLSESEVRERCRQLRAQRDDPLQSRKIRALEENLLKNFK